NSPGLAPGRLEGGTSNLTSRRRVRLPAPRRQPSILGGTPRQPPSPIPTRRHRSGSPIGHRGRLSAAERDQFVSRFPARARSRLLFPLPPSLVTRSSPGRNWSAIEGDADATRLQPSFPQSRRAPPTKPAPARSPAVPGSARNSPVRARARRGLRPGG